MPITMWHCTFISSVLTVFKKTCTHFISTAVLFNAGDNFFNKRYCIANNDTNTAYFVKIMKE